jgi:hypothetical protein
MGMRRRNLSLCMALLAGLWCTTALGQSEQDDALMRWERSINTSRVVRLRELAPQMMPDCRISASAAELDAFFAFWRGFANDEIISMKEFDAQAAKFAAAYGTKPASIDVSSEVPLEKLKTVGPDFPGATEAAREQIERWHLNRCVDAQFHDDRYDGWYGYDGVVRPQHMPTTFARPPGQKAMRIPNLSAVEPIGAIGKLFHAALSRGLLKFSDPNEQRYFFERYDTDYFVNLHESEVTRRWFQGPPWSPATPIVTDDKAN